MFKNLIAEMVRFSVSKEELAELLGISVSTLYSRLGSKGFTCSDACLIRDYFNNKFGTTFTLDYLFATEPVAI